MGGVSGVELLYAAKKASTWGTAVACGALNGFLSRPSGIKEASDVEVDDSLGLYFSGDGTPNAVKCDGDIPAYLRYAGMELLLAMAMGTAGVPVTHAAGTLSKDYVYKPAKSLDGKFITFVKHMKNYIAEVPSVKVTGFTIKGEVGKPLELILNTTGCFINKNTSTGINTLTTANNITIACTDKRVQFSQCVFRMNDQSAIALAPGDQIYPSSFELSFQRKMTGVYGSMTVGTTAKRDVIDEPTNDGLPEIGLKLGFPRHTSATMLTALGNDTRKKLDITATGPIIETTIPYLFMLQFPHLQIKNVDVVDEQGIIKEPIDFICHSASVAPAGMTGITDPFWLSGTNTLATDPLA